MILDYNTAIADGLSLFINSEAHKRYTLADINTYLVLPIPSPARKNQITHIIK